MADILVIDDDELVLESLVELLRREGLSVDTAKNGAEGMRKFRAAPPKTVVVDLLMPVKEGIETILELRQTSPDVRVVAISGGSRQVPGDYLEMAKMLGADEALAKPFSRQQLLAAISGDGPRAQSSAPSRSGRSAAGKGRS